MPVEFYKIHKSDIPFLDRFSKDINAAYALATFWKFYLEQKRENGIGDLYVTTSEIARYSVYEILKIFGKNLYYKNDARSDYCRVNHTISFYLKIYRLIYEILCGLPNVTCVFNGEGVKIYKITAVDFEKESGLYTKLVRAYYIKDALIKYALEHEVDYMSARQSPHNEQISSLMNPTLIQPKPVYVFFKQQKPTPPSNDKPVTFIDESFSFWKSSNTYVFRQKRKLAYDGRDTDRPVKKFILPLQNKTTHTANNPGVSKAQTKKNPYMDFRFLLN